MTLKKLLTILCFVSFPALAGFNSVTVPPVMLHAANAGTGTGYSGNVEYTVTCGDTDSVYVTLTVQTQAGATPLALSEVTGDVGLIRIVKPNVAEKHEIYFSTQTPPVNGTAYVAVLTANAVVSAAKTQVEGFLKTMSKNDKVSVMAGCCDGFTSTSGGITIPSIIMSDGPNGVRPTNGAQATVFPTCSNEASTWDTALANIQGQAKGEEFRALGKNCALGPALNLVYHPQGGRASEYYGEDPYESGHMAAADVRGEQLKGVAATIKHFACNNKEDDRRILSADMSERSLQELYLANFRPSVVQGGDGCWALMGAYNQVNQNVTNQGYACQNKYIQTDVLRNTWGFKYMSMTDWGVNWSFTPGVNFGVDVEMPSASAYTPGALISITDSLINMHVRRILYTHEKIGDLASTYNATAFADQFKGAAHRAAARKVGTAGIVLGKNSNNVLPIPKSGVKIALTGPFANQFRPGPGGSSQVSPAYQTTPQTGISQLLMGTGPYAGHKPAGASTIVTDITTADYIIVFVGVTSETENVDRPSLSVLPADGDNDVAAALAVTTAKTIVVYTGGSAATPGKWSNADAIVFAFYPGGDQGYCIADVLFGNVNPSGKLPVTFPSSASQLPNFTVTANGDLYYPSSDTAHGYFRMDKNGWTPQFYFGYGLSYTTFGYSNLQIFPDSIKAGDRVHVRLTVTNAGTVAGKETAELYLSMPVNGTLPVRVQDLRGFQKVPVDTGVTLAPGASQTVDFTLYPEDMQVYNPNGADYNGTGTWQILAGNYGVRVGTSSQRDLQPTVGGSFTVMP
jgi:beta-glucosidase